MRRPFRANPTYLPTQGVALGWLVSHPWCYWGDRAKVHDRLLEKLASLNHLPTFQTLLDSREPILALAPMQDVTDLPFWKLMSGYGGADVYWTEYFRIRPGSHLEPHILASITGNPTGRPVIAQMIGNSIPDLIRSANELATASDCRDRFEPRLSGAGRLPEMRGRRSAARAAAD